MRKALIVGINYYEHHKNLAGAVNDAIRVENMLERDADGSINFEVITETALDKDSAIDRKTLKELVKSVFADDPDIALFYFSGHGYLEDSKKGYLVTSECDDGDEGISMDDILSFATDSKAKNKVIILDCCHSGKLAQDNIGTSVTLCEGMTILTASTNTQFATEIDGKGVFTTLLIDALNGGAANILGNITPGSVYAHIDQSLGSFGQRPMFKTNVKTFIKLRAVTPSVSLEDLHKITELFPNKNDHNLDPSYEPDSENPNQENCEKFKIMQKYNRVNLVVPEEEDHMYYAAMNSKSCKLTALGIHYWNLVNIKRI